MVNNVKKFTVMGLMVFVAFCMVSCGTIGNLALGLLDSDSGSSGDSKSSAAPSEPDPSKPGWQQNKDGSWVYVQGSLPERQEKGSDEMYITIRNDLYENIATVYARAAGSTSWGNPINNNIPSKNSAANIRIPLSIAQNFDLKAVLPNGAEKVLSNLKAGSDNAQFTFK